MAERRKLHEIVMRDVLTAILRGEYQVGGSLPREIDLAAQHDVSRYVARECIQALRDRGVLTVKHGRGTTIAPPARWSLFDPALLDALLDGQEGHAARADGAALLALLWPEAAGLAAEHRNANDLERLEHALAESEHRFLEQLTLAADNRFLGHVLLALDRAMPARTPTATLDEVLDAVRAGDPDAARAAMRAYAGAA